MTLGAAPLNMQDPQQVCALLESAAEAMRECDFRRGSSVHLPARGRLLLTGDLHDNPTHLEAVKLAARLDRGPDHHVVLHELIHGDRLVNGVDLSYRMLCRAAQLVQVGDTRPGRSWQSAQRRCVPVAVAAAAACAVWQLAQRAHQPPSAGVGRGLCAA